MDLLTDMRERVTRLSGWPELGSEAAELLAGAARLSDESVLLALGEAAGLANDAARLQTVLAGVLAQRSSRDLGHGGLSAVHGHASPTALIQSITGGTKADAARQVRVGTALFDGADMGARPDGEGTDGADDAAGISGAGTPPRSVG